jgi:hypothetical protein
MPRKAQPRRAQPHSGVMLTVRVPESLIRALDDHVERMRVQSPHLDPTRSDAIRSLLFGALERRNALKPPGSEQNHAPAKDDASAR